MDVVTGARETLRSDLYSKVAHYRHKIFVERLGWQLQTKDGAELDQFDRSDTVYVIAQDDDGQVIGCARLLPTIRPYLLANVFPYLLNGMEPPRSLDVWELSRFSAVDLSGTVNTGRYRFSSLTAVRLLEASLEFAGSHSAKRLITVSPLGVERLLHRAGFHAHRAGPPMAIDGDPFFACWIEIDHADRKFRENRWGTSKRELIDELSSID